MAKAKTAREKQIDLAKSVAKRVLAVFIASGLGVLGAGAIVGVDVVSSVFMAGIIGVASVVEKLARAYIDDGRITMAEINSAFSGQTGRAQK
tara:strand:- start:930 stop:1205 length:276 start_codon:yes stop_codon:yes gene_type:complete